MDPTEGITWVCNHQDLVKTALVWAMGIMPVASVFAWASAKWNMLPPFAQGIVQVIAGNFGHAAENFFTSRGTPK